MGMFRLGTFFLTQIFVDIVFQCRGFVPCPANEASHNIDRHSQKVYHSSLCLSMKHYISINFLQEGVER